MLEDIPKNTAEASVESGNVIVNLDKLLQDALNNEQDPKKKMELQILLEERARNHELAKVQESKRLEELHKAAENQPVPNEGNVEFRADKFRVEPEGIKHAGVSEFSVNEPVPQASPEAFPILDINKFIPEAKDFNALYDALNLLGETEHPDGPFDGAKWKALIKGLENLLNSGKDIDVAALDLGVAGITRRFGLRDKVKQLIQAKIVEKSIV